MASMKRPSASTPPLPPPLQIELHLRQGQPIVRPLPTGFDALALKWSYIARNRERWRTTGEDPAQGDANPLLGVLQAVDIERLAADPVVEVVVPYMAAREDFAWSMRLFPWEYALSALTRAQRRGPMTVVRVLGPSRTEEPTVALTRAAVLQSAPAGLERWYDTVGEGDLMLTSLGLSPTDAPRLNNATRTTLRAWLEAENPTLLHVAGCDSHQAGALLRLETTEEAVRDGFALAMTGGTAPDLVPAESLAQLLNSGSPKPELVVLNFYNSAARIAARCTALGAKFAIGYHDLIDDGLAAEFCATLYRALQESDGQMLEAFQAALAQVRQQPDKMRGACIVLWSAVPLLHPAAARATQERRSKGLVRTAQEIPDWQKVRVVCEPLPRINYSLLHNRKSLFRSLQVYRNNVAGEIRDIEVSVTLNTGEGSAPFVSAFSLAPDKTLEDLTSKVVVPLTSSLIRRQSERVQSSVTVQVLCNKERAFLETRRVGLCPVDEWQDGEVEEWGWLPSFVLPRDPAVPRIIDSAQILLCSLADDPAAGFDGYQSIDSAAPEFEQRYAAVDRQVQSIWHAIVHHHPLSYINPPPSYGNSTQRIRTPSQVVGERRGTCIDLALLLAACLEYVDIYPVLFLLTGHAFVGYWRGDDLHREFLAIKGLEPGFAAANEGEHMASGAAGSNQGAQVLDQGQHLEVRQRVNEGQIVPLEATWLSQRGGFAAAADEGRKNLRLKREFQAMVDVKIARDEGVTPLPLLGESA